MSDHHEPTEPEIFGISAEFDDPDAVLEAAKAAYGAGYRQMDAYSPFPIHGLSEAIGYSKSKVPLCTLIGGLTGAAAGFGLQWFASVVHYPYSIGGRPDFSWPAWIPITFEMMVLFAAFTAGLSMLAFNGLPRPYHSIFNAKNFERATSDRFFLCIESNDGKYDPDGTRQFLEGLDPKPLEVSEVES